MSGRHLIFFVPGLMGSELLAPSLSGLGGDQVWSSSVEHNYRLLLENPSVLKFHGPSVLETQLLLALRLPFGGQVPIYAGLDRMLRQAARANLDFEYKAYSYDWRDSIVRSSGKLADLIEARLNSSRTRDCRVTLIGHSMGCLVCRLTVPLLRHVTPSNMSLVEIAPPALGSPMAARALLADFAAPLFNVFVRMYYRWKNGPRALEVLRECLHTYPALYELLPHREKQFLLGQDGNSHNPLTLAGAALADGQASTALSTHASLGVAAATLLAAGTPHAILIGASRRRRTDETYRLASPHEALRLMPPLPCTSTTAGDGTVPHWSSRDPYGHAAIHEIAGVEHTTMCSDPRLLRVLDLIVASIARGDKLAMPKK